MSISPLWEFFYILRLTNNEGSIDLTSSGWLLKLGSSGHEIVSYLNEDLIEIPSNLICERDLIKEVFWQKLSRDDLEQLDSKVILCPTNAITYKINEEVLKLLEGEMCTYFSSNSIKDVTEEDNYRYPVEFLNKTPSGLAPYVLNFKKGAIIMLLHNLYTKRGLCDGTMLIIKDLRK